MASGLNSNSPSILIIGAGVAGLAAAVRLIDFGYEKVKIFEAEDRLGGRIHTIPIDDYLMDLGAHWIHGEVNNPIFTMGQELSLLEHSGDYANVQFILSDGSVFPQELGMTLFEESGNLLQDKDSLNEIKGSVEDYLVARCRQLAKGLVTDPAILNAYMNWLIKFECTIEGCDSLKEPSAIGLCQYRQCEGDLVINWKSGGYSTFIDVLLRHHPKSVGKPFDVKNVVVFNEEVEKLDWSGLGVLVKTKDGAVHRFDHVIVTVSLGVLKEKYKTLFSPQLPPEKIRTILGLGIGTVDKIIIIFEYRWWPEDCSGFSLLWLEEKEKEKETVEKDEFDWERGIVGFYAQNRAPNTLIAWLVGADARSMEACPLEDVKVGVMRVLKRFLSHIYSVPEPERIYRTTWFSNPHFRGSYSFRSMNSEALQSRAEILAEPVTNTFNKEVLLFAGEATHSSFYSTVHGALLTGWREADRIRDIYNGTQPIDVESSVPKLPKSSL